MCALPTGHAAPLKVPETAVMAVHLGELGFMRSVYTNEIAQPFKEAGRKLPQAFPENREECIGAAPGVACHDAAPSVTVRAVSDLGIAPGHTTSDVTSAERLHGSLKTLEARWRALRSGQEENTDDH